MRHWPALLAPLLLGACATIFEGTTQQITVDTDPPGAECGLYRDGQRIATIPTTPGSALVKKSNQDISMLCVKQGHQQVSLLNRADVAGWVAGNIVFGILGGGIGLIVDSATGSGNKYDGKVSFTMPPLPAEALAEPAALPSSFSLPSPPSEPASAPNVNPTVVGAGMPTPRPGN